MNRSLAVILLLPVVAFAAPVPKVKESKLLVCSGGVVTMMNPDGTNSKVVHESADEEFVYKAQLSPSGDRFVLWYLPKEMERETKLTLKAEGIKGETELGKLYELKSLFWSADGKSLLGTSLDKKAHQSPGDSKVVYRSWRMDAKSGERMELDIPGECHLFALVPGSDKVACVRETHKKPDGGAYFHPESETYISDAAKYDPTVVIAETVDFQPIAIFPDGKRWFGVKSGGAGPDDLKWGVYTAGEKEPVMWKENSFGFYHVLSPNGKILASVKGRVVDGRRKGCEIRTMSVDGTEVKKIAEFDKDVTHIDWR